MVHNIIIYLFKKNKESYLKLPPDTMVNSLLRVTTKYHMVSNMYLRLISMANISVEKYGQYNTAITGKHLYKQFPWLSITK